MSDRVTYKRLKEWIASYNANNQHKVELSAFDDAYWIYDAETGNRLCSDISPARTWELFCMWKSGFRTALEDVRKGKFVVVKGEIEYGTNN